MPIRDWRNVPDLRERIVPATEAAVSAYLSEIGLPLNRHTPVDALQLPSDRRSLSGVIFGVIDSFRKTANAVASPNLVQVVTRGRIGQVPTLDSVQARISSDFPIRKGWGYNSDTVLCAPLPSSEGYWSGWRLEVGHHVQIVGGSSRSSVHGWRLSLETDRGIGLLLKLNMDSTRNAREKNRQSAEEDDAHVLSERTAVEVERGRLSSPFQGGAPSLGKRRR